MEEKQVALALFAILVIFMILLSLGKVYLGCSIRDEFHRAYSFNEFMNRCEKSYKNGSTVYGTYYMSEDYEAGAKWCVNNIKKCVKQYEN